MTDYFAEFVETARRGQVAWFHPSGEYRTFPRNTDWAVPTFDFGALPFTAKDFEDHDPLVRDAITDVYENGLRLPFPRCIFMMNDPRPCGTKWLDNQPDFFELTQDGDNILVRNFNRACRSGVVMWAFEDDIISLNARTGTGLSPNIQKFHLMDHYKIIQSKIDAIKISLGFLAAASTVREPVTSDMMVSVNRGREGAGLTPIPPTIKLSLREPTSRAGHGRGGSSTSPIPHDRRAHLRRLQSGKVVTVRACAIHGGSSTPRRYEITV